MIIIGGRGPMMGVTFRFEGAPPTPSEIEGRLREHMGARLFGAIDDLELIAPHAGEAATTLRVTSMDLVAIAYTQRVIAELGGQRVRLGSGEEVALRLPSWVAQAWPSYSLLQRIKIRLIGPHML